MMISSFNAIIDYITASIQDADDIFETQTPLMSRSKPVQHCILMEFPRTRQVPILVINGTDVTGRDFARLPTGFNRQKMAYANECMCLIV